MLEVFLPIAYVLRAIGMGVSTVAVGLVVDPLALVLIPVHMPESALTVRFVKAPVTLIPGTILPDLNASTVAVLALPLAEVLGSIFEHELRPILHGLIVVSLASFQSHAVLNRARVFLLSSELFLSHYRRIRRQTRHGRADTVTASPRLKPRYDLNLASQKVHPLCIRHDF